jgi:hypothetical protein
MKAFFLDINISKKKLKLEFKKKSNVIEICILYELSV